MRLWEMVQLIVKVALRNLWLYRFKSLVIACLLGFGSFLYVLGLSLLRDVESSMSDSIVGSVSGHLQVYSAKSKDELALFGGGFMGRSDIGEITDIVPLRAAVMQNPNVAAFIPMGMDMSMLGRGNEMDEQLDALRKALKSEDPALIKNQVEQLRFQLEQLKKELEAQRVLVRDTKDIELDAANIAKIEVPDFLDSLSIRDEDKLQFLETKLGPLSGQKTPIYLQYIGTDIDLFQQNFQKFKLVEGAILPAGQRGMMISRRIREEFLKNVAARLFDKLEKRTLEAKIKIKGDPENERNVTALVRQYSGIVSSLTRSQAENLSVALKAAGIEGKTGEPDIISFLSSQLQNFLNVDDSNIAERFALFYKNIAPQLKLYEISPGETIMLRAYTRSGYVKSLPLKVYGVYSFSGLEDSDLSGAFNLIDLISFRELYGKMTETSLKELEDMRVQVGIKDVAASDAEAALFGEDSSDTIESNAAVAIPLDGGVRTPIDIKPVIADNFQIAEISRGLALNAAIKLKDPRKIEQTRTELENYFKQNSIDAQVVDWQKASGIIGQFVKIIRLVLIFAIGVIFLVTLVIINNSIIVGTLNRMREIGTMRAIGAHKSFVVWLFLAETALTGLLGTLVGTVGATLLLFYLSKHGIPAMTDVVAFFFSGPRLYPQLRWPLIISAPFLVTLLATLSSIYSARYAALVQPAEAMQEKE